jgi:hypothetical protein
MSPGSIYRSIGHMTQQRPRDAMDAKKDHVSSSNEPWRELLRLRVCKESFEISQSG